MKQIITLLLLITCTHLFADDFEWKSIDTLKLNKYEINYVKIDCYDKNNCMAVANAAFIAPINRITTDGGIHWVTTLKDTQIIDNETGEFYQPYSAVDLVYTENTSIIFCGGGIYWRNTKDGWIKDTVDKKLLNSMQGKFANDSVGYAFYPSVRQFKTLNSGKNWNKIEISLKDHDTLPFNEIRNFLCLDETKIIALAMYHHVDTTNWKSLGVDHFILKSIDGGDSWDITPENNLILSGNLDFLNENIGATVGKEYVGQKTKSVLTLTTDGGYTWEKKIDTLVKWSDGLTGVEFVSDSVGFAWGWYLQVWRTTDAGESWHLIRTEEQAALKWNHTNSFDFVDEHTVYAVEKSWGIIFKGTISPMGILSFEPYYIPDLIHSYPNPISSGETLTLKIESPQTSEVSIEMYNSLGKRCGNTFETKLIKGINHIEYNSTNLSSGSYYIMLIYPDGEIFDEQIIVE